MIKTKRTRAKNFSEREDKTVIEHIKQTPDNLSFAFEKAAIKLNRTVKSVRQRYYATLRTKASILTVGSKRGFTQNVKNTHKDKNGNVKSQATNPIQYVLREILELPIDDRKQIVNFIESVNILNQN